jgi:hypothetical protein
MRWILMWNGKPRRIGRSKMPRTIDPYKARDLAWGMGNVIERGGRFQTRWWEGNSRRAKSFHSREDTEDWLRSRARSIGGKASAIPRSRYANNVVYFVQGVDGGPIKIGHARNVADRLRAMQLGSPVQLGTLATMDGGTELETVLHERFAHLRTHGEWFKPVPALLRWIVDNATTWTG